MAQTIHPRRQPICLITGATDGVGKATARALALKGFQVVIAARNPAKAKAVQAELQSVSAAPIEVMVGDLARLADVAQIAEAFKARYGWLDVLINNAGVMRPRRDLTPDGVEATWQVNYLSAFLLTRLLVGELTASDQGRIINLSSSVYSVGKLDGDEATRAHGYSAMGAYAASKLAMLLFTQELARQLKDTRVTANAVHPGVVRTQMLATAEGLFKLVALLATPFAASPDKGASTSVYLASAPALATTSGSYFVDGRPRAVRSPFDTDEARERLWRSSLDELQARGFRLG